jgi:Putative peptidoglycan binding domain
VADYPNRIAGTLLVGLIIAICVNALVLQQSRHPAPLFRKSFALPAAVTQAQATNTAPNVPAQPTRDPIDQLLQSAPEKPPLHERPGKKQSAEAKPVRDSISQLLTSNAAQTPAEESKTVLAAQRALVKLGFVVKPDGIVGGATRQAIEQFERDHGLPVQGELSPKVLRELSAQSGLAIE